MKITGYTIIFTILGILSLIGFIQFEILIYNDWWLGRNKLKNTDHFGFILINIIILIVIIFILYISSDIFKKLDKLLKKRIL